MRMKGNDMQITSRKILQIITSVLLIILCGFSVSGFAADNTECTYLSGSNTGGNNYNVYSSPTYSYLTACEDGYMRVQGVADEGAYAVYYDGDFRLLKRTVITGGLEYFGGFYESQDNYYIVSGQPNTEESDSVEVFRITKYDKDWNVIGFCGLYGANTYRPFDAGGCRMAMDGKHLLIRTAHTMYTSNDGLNHQANVTIEVDTDAMNVTDSFTGILNVNYGYVSHSFNQFIQVEDHKIVAADHGDAYPRSIVLCCYPADVTAGTFQGRTANTTVMKFPGETGDNATGSSLGALEISDTSYLLAGNSVFKDSDDESLLRTFPRDIFVASVNKSTKAVSVTWLTDLADNDATASTPHMVRIADDKYLVLWTRGTNVECAFVDGNGDKTGGIYSFKGSLSDCVPLVSGSDVIWYTWKDSEETFYMLSVNDPENPEIITTSYDHDYQLTETADGIAYLTCSKCGDKVSGKVPTDFIAAWRAGDSGYYYYVNSLDLDISEAAGYYIPSLSYSADSDNTYSDMVVETDDSDAVITDTGGRTGKIAFSDAGRYTVTVYPKYNPDLRKTYTVNVTKPLEGVSLSAMPQTSQEYGKEITLNAAPDGGKGTITYKFTATDSSGSVTTLYEGTEASCSWKPAAAGSYSIKAEASDSDDPDAAVESEALLYTVEKAARPAAMPSEEYSVPYSTSVLSSEILKNVENWEFSSADTGTYLEVGEPAVFTAFYTGSDKDSFITNTVQITVTRSECDHDYTYTVKTPATCISAGTGVYECRKCSDTYEEEIPIDPANHVHITIVPGIEATAESEGLTEGRVCEDCGAVLTEQTVIPKKEDNTPAQNDPQNGSQNTSQSISQSISGEGAENAIKDLPAAKITKPAAAKKKATVKWKKLNAKNLKKISGIEIQIATDPGFTNIVKTTTAGKKKTSKKITGLKTRTRYWVRIRTYKNAADGKHISAWKTKTLKTK